MNPIKKLLTWCLQQLLKSIIVFVLALVILWLLFFRGPIALAEAPDVPETKVALLPELVPICGCESVGNPKAEPKQFKNGKVITNKNRNGSTDYGLCQINDFAWGKVAQREGWDYINSEQDHIKLANYIYVSQGNRPWSASKKCWQ